MNLTQQQLQWWRQLDIGVTYICGRRAQGVTFTSQMWLANEMCIAEGLGEPIHCTVVVREHSFIPHVMRMWQQWVPFATINKQYRINIGESTVQFFPISTRRADSMRGRRRDIVVFDDHYRMETEDRNWELIDTIKLVHKKIICTSTYGEPLMWSDEPNEPSKGDWWIDEYYKLYVFDGDEWKDSVDGTPLENTKTFSERFDHAMKGIKP